MHAYLIYQGQEVSYVTCAGGDHSPKSALKPHNRIKCCNFHVRIADIVSSIHTEKDWLTHCRRFHLPRCVPREDLHKKRGKGPGKDGLTGNSIALLLYKVVKGHS